MDRIQRQTGVAAVVLPGLAEGKTGAAAAFQRHVTGEGKGGLAHIEINHCRLFGSFQLVGAVLLWETLPAVPTAWTGWVSVK